MTISTTWCTSAKSEIFSAAHCFQGPAVPTGSTTSGAFTITSLSSVSGLAVGMSVVDTGFGGVPTGAVIASIDSGSQITVSKAATATNSTVFSITGDHMAMVLINASPVGTYGAATTNYSQVTSNGDEVSGTGYTTGGIVMTNTSPAISGTQSYVNFTNPSWTSATFSTSGAVIVNESKRLGGTAGRTVGTYDFGGVQSVSSGTFTVLLPSAPNTVLTIT